jgi:hypothetical protein
MQERVTPEMIRSAAAMIDLHVSDDELESVRERVQLVFDAVDQFAHLTENTAELDVRFNANWEAEPA